MKKLRISIIVALVAVSAFGNLALAGESPWSVCQDHSYSGGTAVNGCGSVSSGCGGTCGFTQSTSTYYYHTCDGFAFSSCTTDPPLVVKITMTPGTCSGGLSGSTGCQCAIGSGTTTGYISLPQCH